MSTEDITTFPWRIGKCVMLRPFCEADTQILCMWMNDEETTETLLRFLPVTPSLEKDWLGSIEKDYKNRSPSNITVAIADLEGRLLGTIGLNNIDWINRTARTGSVIGKSADRGKGYATEAKLLLLKFAFDWLNLRMIFSDIKEGNGASLRVQEKCGYQTVAFIPYVFDRNGTLLGEHILVVTRETWLPEWEKYQKAC